MYYVDGVPHSERSPKNQKILDLFVRKEVLKDITELVQYVFDTATTDNAPPFSMEDIQYEYVLCCPNCGEETLEEVVVEPSMVNPDYDNTADPDERYSCPVCGTPYGTQEEARQCCVGQIAYLCTNCQSLISQEQLDKMDTFPEPGKVVWYLVTDWLGSQLKDFGEIVIQTPDYSIWGWEGGSQGLTDDHAIEQICRGLGILEGQPHEWPVQ